MSLYKILTYDGVETFCRNIPAHSKVDVTSKVVSNDQASQIFSDLYQGRPVRMFVQDMSKKRATSQKREVAAALSHENHAYRVKTVQDGYYPFDVKLKFTLPRGYIETLTER